MKLDLRNGWLWLKFCRVKQNIYVCVWQREREREREREHCIYGTYDLGLWSFTFVSVCSNMFLCFGLLCLFRHYVRKICSICSNVISYHVSFNSSIFRLVSQYLFIIICFYFVASFPPYALKSSSLRSF